MRVIEYMPHGRNYMGGIEREGGCENRGRESSEERRKVMTYIYKNVTMKLIIK